NAARAGIGRAGVLVVAVGGGGAERAASEGGAGALPAAVADVVEGAGVAVVARRVGRLEGVRRAVDARPRAHLGRVTDVGRRAADRARVGGRVNAAAAPVARIRAAHVAVVRAHGTARGRRADALPGLTAIRRRAPAAVVTRGPVDHGGAGARAGLAGVGAGAGVLIVAGRPVADLGGDAGRAPAGSAGGAGVAVIAARARERRHRAARGPVAGQRVALVRGAGDGGADALPAAGAGIVERAGVAVVARRARVGGHGAARRAVTHPCVARIRGAGDGGAGALPGAVGGVGVGAGVGVVGRRAGGGGGGGGRVG